MKRVLQQLGVYKKDALLCVGLTTLEVIMEILLPFITARLIAEFITARLIAEGLEASNLSAVYRYGAVLVVMALFSLIFGATAGRFAASASSGLAANLREAIYANIQTFSFSNIDKFSVPGLVTRMTTDITNVQQAFMMVIRIAVRSPLSLIFSFAMCMYINPGLPGGGRRRHHGGHPAHLQPGVPQVRRPERQRPGERIRHPGGEGLCAGAL